MLCRALGSQGYSDSPGAPSCWRFPQPVKRPHYAGGLHSEPWNQAGVGQSPLEGSDLWRDPRREASRQKMPQLSGLQERPVAALGLLRTLLCSWKPKSWPWTKAHHLRVWVGSCPAPRVQYLQNKARPSPADRLSPPKSTLTSSRNGFPQPASPYGSPL